MGTGGQIDAREISRSLGEMHSLLYSLRAKRPREVRMEGARAYLRPGEDSAFPSSSSNKLQVFDLAGVDVVETVLAGKHAFEEAGIGHWFVELGAGATAEMVRELMREFGARPRTQVRYPVLARVPEPAPSAQTSLEIVRPTMEAVRAHEAEIEAIWEKPGAATSMLSAMERPANFAPVLGMCDGRAVAMGMLVIGDKAGGVSYLSAGGTHPDFRGRGGQTAIIAERLRIAAERGRSVCVSETVLTVETSTSNLLKAGFRIVYEWAVLEIGVFKGT